MPIRLLLDPVEGAALPAASPDCLVAGSPVVPLSLLPLELPRHSPAALIPAVPHVVQVVPILRAGLVLLEQTSMVLPASQTFHVGYVRDDDTLQVSAALSLCGCCPQPLVAQREGRCWPLALARHTLLFRTTLSHRALLRAGWGALWKV